MLQDADQLSAAAASPVQVANRYTDTVLYAWKCTLGCLPQQLDGMQAQEHSAEC